MQTVDVLCHDRLQEPARLQLRKRKVGRVRPGLREHVESERVELPDALRVAAERVDRCDLVGIEALPDPGRAPKVRNAALRADPRARERDAGLIRLDEVGESTRTHARQYCQRA